MEEAPIAAWVAAFEHLFEISGADGDREQPPIAYCIEIGTRAVATEVLAALNERIPHRAPQPCEFAGDYAKTPDGRPAWRFWISSIHRSPRFDDGWAVELNYMAGPLHGAGWRCNVKESAGHWRVTDCDRTFTS
ncbi:hypothetical protein [Longimicrobium sp.]|uniref:hypothetical protein n=1 Tax=Longimicrobium sp. TaxID=2029185 RepID=UPI002F93D759